MKKDKIKFRTDFLLPKNNFFVGLGSVLNLAGSYFEYEYSKSANEADLKALTSDWGNVGEDMRQIKEKLKSSDSSLSIHW